MNTKTLILLSGMSLIALQTAAQPLPTPVARYEFTGGTATDVTGHGHHGTLMGTLPATAGRSGTADGALQFDVAGYVSVPAHTALDLKEWTISSVVRMDSFEQGDCQVSKIVQRGDQYGANYLCLEINDNFKDQNCAVFTPTAQQAVPSAAGAPNSYTLNPTDTIKLNTWYCITATYGNDTMKAYVDGVLTQIAYWPDQYGTGPGGYPSIAPLTIGMGQGSGGMTYWWRGAIDELTIYEMVLSPGQIKTLCNPPAAGIPGHDREGGIGAAYPNPAATQLTLPVKGITGPLTMTLLAADGRVVATGNYKLTGGEERILLPTEDLAPGIYLLRAVAGGQSKTQMISRL